MRAFRQRLDDPLVGWALVVMFVVVRVLLPARRSGRPTRSRPAGAADFDRCCLGPNPLLQNHILVAFHPPMLYLGYVGFTVPFAFAIAALVTGRVGEGWLVETRRWTLFAWGFLTDRHRARRVVELRGARLGRRTGRWDPVENASLPAVAHRHRLHPLGDGAGAPRDAARLEPVAARAPRSRSRSSARSSPVGRARLACTRSATAPIGPWLLGVLRRRRRRVARADRAGAATGCGRPGAIDSPVSREGAFLANNVLFAVFAFVVLLGTVFPLHRRGAAGPPDLGRRAVLRPDDDADRARAAVPDGASRRCCRGARPVERAAARPAVLAGVVRRRRAGRSPCCVGADGFAPLRRLRPRRVRRRRGAAPARAGDPPPGLARPASAGPTAG